LELEPPPIKHYRLLQIRVRSYFTEFFIFQGYSVSTSKAPSIMSQYGANDYQEQQPQNSFAPHPNQTQNHYSTGQSSYGPPPYTDSEQGYTQGDQYTRPQHYCTNSGYDQRYYEAAANIPQSHAAPQSNFAPEGANASYYNGEPISDPKDPNGEKGLGSTVVGGAAGGYMGHKMGGGWSTAAGAAAGAIGMNVLSHKM
jgi:hypothetical protein